MIRKRLLPAAARGAPASRLGTPRSQSPELLPAAATLPPLLRHCRPVWARLLTQQADLTQHGVLTSPHEQTSPLLLGCLRRQGLGPAPAPGR